jgi:hypothetical protein
MPRALTIDLPFATVNPIEIDLEQLALLKQFKGAQSLYIKTGADILTITIAGTRQVFTLPPNRSAYLPIVAPQTSQIITFQSAGAGLLTVLLMNYYVAPHVWATT